MDVGTLPCSVERQGNTHAQHKRVPYTAFGTTVYNIEFCYVCHVRDYRFCVLRALLEEEVTFASRQAVPSIQPVHRLYMIHRRYLRCNVGVDSIDVLLLYVLTSGARCESITRPHQVSRA